jgi:hypothetical protein
VEGLYDLTSHLEENEAFGGNTGGYWMKKKRGDLLPLNLYRKLSIKGDSSSEFRADHKSWGNCYWYWDGQPAHIYGNWRIEEGDFAYYYANKDLQGDLSYALQAAASRIYSTGWDLLTFMGEFRDTVRLFNGIQKRYADKIAGILKNTDNVFANRAVKKNLDQLQEALASTYLEGRYGFRTLAYDMQDFEKAMARINDQRVRFREGVSAGTHTNVQAGTWTENWTSYSLNTHAWTKESTYSARAVVVADIEPPKLAFNPLVTGWELTTLSFVVDWFVDVGQYLESLSFLALARTWYGGYGYKIDVTTNVSTLSVQPYTSQVNSVHVDYRANAHGTLVSRSPASTLSYLPLIKVRLNEFKVLDMLALLSTRLNVVTRLAKTF